MDVGGFFCGDNNPDPSIVMVEVGKWQGDIPFSTSMEGSDE